MASVEVTPHLFFFLLSTVLTLGGAIGVVTNRNLVRGSIWLIVSLFGVAGYFVLLHAPFLAAVQVLVYIGAIGILITFAVMLTRGMTNLQSRYLNYWWLGGLASILAFGILFFTVIEPIWGDRTDASEGGVGSTVALGVALVSGDGFVLPFEVAAVLLTAAMIGAIVLAREDESSSE